MWQAVQEKTYFYEWSLMPAVKRHLGYDLHVERLRCDYTFLDPNQVPLIAVEAENAHQTAAHEMHCLCSLAAPLKILLLSCDWQASEKAKYLPEWREIIRAHHAVVSVNCHYGIIVGEWDEPDDALLKFSFTLLDTDGAILEDEIRSVAE